MANEKPPSEIAVIDETTIRNKIYEVRGQKVMLDFDLAEIYGYETKSFNRQVRNNIDRFAGEDFMFRLTKEELEILRCKNFTSSWGGTKTLLMLKSVPENVDVIIFSDNVNNILRLSEYRAFHAEYPNIRLSFQRTGGKFGFLKS